MRTYPEYEEQVAFIKWCKLASRTMPELKLIYCNHNTQMLNKMQAMRWKLLGGRAGVPDLFLPVANLQYKGLYIEFKAPALKPKTSRSKGGLSEEQLEFFPILEEQGYKVAVCYSWLEAKEEVTYYLKQNTIESDDWKHGDRILITNAKGYTNGTYIVDTDGKLIFESSILCGND